MCVKRLFALIDSKRLGPLLLLGKHTCSVVLFSSEVSLPLSNVCLLGLRMFMKIEESASLMHSTLMDVTELMALTNSTGVTSREERPKRFD